ncbi:hypothetical protein Pfo_022338 [Paulownia fortunei]|nr:hypothetical protein Pfo_022338 [Paulownia fortunei]
MVRPPSIDSNGMKKGAWSEEEDSKLSAYIQRHGHWNWRLLPKYAGLARCGKSCRLRWVNYLKPGVKRGNFSKQEEDLIVQLHAQLGNKWSAIARKLPGRTDNEIKNFWHTRIGKRSKRSQSAKIDRGHSNKASKTTQTESPSLDDLRKHENSATLFDANSSDSNAEPQVDLWAHPLPDDEFFYPELDYNKLSSSDSSYLSVLDRIATDDLSVISFDSVAQPIQGNFWGESFGSNTSHSQSESSYIWAQEVGGYDLQYFDLGMNLF